jgi:signal transduction histidine kinase
VIVHGRLLPRLWEGLRPLDPIRSIKMKFALLVAASAVVTAGITWYGLEILGWRPRYILTTAVLLSLTVSQLLAHGMTAPLRQMTAAARELASGRAAPPVRSSSRDEVGDLARAFTAMSQQLATVDAQRRELLANVGHELRTPVAALRAQLENLADGVRPADPTALAEVLEQVERLGDLLADLLDLARADGGAVPLDRRPVPVAALVDGVVRQVGTARPGRWIEVRVEPPGLVVDADPHRLGQVLTNLLDNATRHAPNGGRVQVQAVADSSGGLVLEVTDDGPGIPPDRWETVFGRFRGGTGEIAVIGSDGAPSGVDGGTGLGLAIARWAVVLHGGRIAVVPVEPGGCRIRVEIPPSAAGSPQDLHRPDTGSSPPPTYGPGHDLSTPA